MTLTAGLTRHVYALTLSVGPVLVAGGAHLRARRADRRARERLSEWARARGLVILSFMPCRVDRSPFWAASSRARVYELSVRDAGGGVHPAWGCVAPEAAPERQVEVVVAQATDPLPARRPGMIRS